jgi:hypothetical protein
VARPPAPGGTISITNGAVKVTLSPKGLTARVIDGVQPKVSFQQQFDATPADAQAVPHRRIATPVGDAQAMVLSFGSDLTWLYAYLTADAARVQSAQVRVELPGRTATLVDDVFPFEFSPPLRADERTVRVTFQVRDPAGKSTRTEASQFRLAR